MQSLDSKKFPRLFKNWHGDTVVEFYDHSGVVHVVDMSCLVGLHADLSEPKTVIQFSTGIFPTNYAYEELRDFLYPITQEE